MREQYVEHDPANNKPYVEYTPPFFNRWQKSLKVDDQAKRGLVGLILATRPLTLLLLLIAIGAAAFGAFMLAL